MVERGREGMEEASGGGNNGAREMRNGLMEERGRKGNFKGDP